MTKSSMLQTARIGSLSAILSLLALVILTVGVSAQAVSVGHGAAHAKGAKVDIISSHGQYAFDKTHITVHQGEKATLCNKTSISQTIQYSGFDIYTIPANTCKSQKVSFSPGRYTVNLKSNPGAKLTIIVK